MNTATNNQKVSKIRKESFFKKYKLDSELIELIKDSPSNNFLLNPPIHNIYQNNQKNFG